MSTAALVFQGGIPGSNTAQEISVFNADDSNVQCVARPSGAPDDIQWGDDAWSSDTWILFAVAQRIDGCFKVRLDKIRPDGSPRTTVTDGGPNCTPDGMEQSGDADPGFSADGKMIYNSRGFPRAPIGLPGARNDGCTRARSTLGHRGKSKSILSLPNARSCVEGVPTGLPGGKRIALVHLCVGEPHASVTITDTNGSYRTWIADGFGPDWNPVAKPSP
jgi:hypothetical protein